MRYMALTIIPDALFFYTIDFIVLNVLKLTKIIHSAEALKMKKPLIGITCRYNEETLESSLIPTYMDSVSELGAIPILLYCTNDETLLKEWATLCDGLMISGGPDINPEIYGETPHPKTNKPSKSRDKTEGLLFNMFREQNKPVLAICRGVQLVNALMGGNLTQDIPSIIGTDVVHSIPNLIPAWHSMKFLPNTRLHNIIGETECTVNSFHHQCISKVAPALKAVAFAPDGIIEAVESTDESWLIGVQWHPERTFKDDEPSRKIFSAFVDACSK